MKRHFCRGSVLMEFVIVAPLYFILLGGIFFLGELGLNRIRLHIADHTGTWLGATRFSSSNIGGFIRNTLFRETFKLEGTLQVDRSTDASNINRFMALYLGKIKELKISMPDWARGMFTMQNAMPNEGATQLALEKDYTYFEDDQNVFRSACCHRLPGVEQERGVGLQAQQLLSGLLVGAITDEWVGGDPSTYRPQISSQDQEVDAGRILSEWAE